MSHSPERSVIHHTYSDAPTVQGICTMVRKRLPGHEAYKMTVNGDTFGIHIMTIESEGTRPQHHDESSAGNVLHPDSPREMVNFYWSFKELPPWYKSRKLGWYAYGLLPSSVVDQACGGLSSICGRVVAGFFGGQTSLTRGIMLPGRDGNFALPLAEWVADHVNDSGRMGFASIW